jgi:hypothetical protein
VIGGRRVIDSSGKSQNLAAHEVYDFARDTWELLPDLPACVAGAAAAEWQGCIYLFGGEKLDPPPAEIFSTVWRYDAASGWTEVDVMRGRHGLGAVACSDGIHICLVVRRTRTWTAPAITTRCSAPELLNRPSRRAPQSTVRSSVDRRSTDRPFGGVRLCDTSPGAAVICSSVPDVAGHLRAPENVGSRLLSLLQSAPDQTFSAMFRTAKKPNCRRLLGVRLGGSRAERYAETLSD